MPRKVNKPSSRTPKKPASKVKVPKKIPKTVGRTGRRAVPEKTTGY